MPFLKDLLAVKSIEGFQPTLKTPPVQGSQPNQNPYRRCPLPPFNATPDTLRQFDESGKVPAHRVIPLPVVVAGTGGSVTNVTNVTTTPSGGGSSGGGTTPSTLATASVSITVPALTAGQVYQTSVQMSRTFQLIALNAKLVCEVRVYGSAVAQGGDVARITDAAPPFEISQNIITDVVFDTAPFQWNWQNRIAGNADNPQTPKIYITVINPTGVGVGANTISLTYVPLVP